jgi:hypothetical protein
VLRDDLRQLLVLAGEVDIQDVLERADAVLRVGPIIDPVVDRAPGHAENVGQLLLIHPPAFHRAADSDPDLRLGGHVP